MWAKLAEIIRINNEGTFIFQHFTKKLCKTAAPQNPLLAAVLLSILAAFKVVTKPVGLFSFMGVC